MAYVYGHYTLDGRLFYIGKGTGKRAWVKDNRNPYWKNTVAKYGWEVRILEDNLTEEQAFVKERQLIEEMGVDNLTNLSTGGKGSYAGCIQSVEAQEKKSKAMKEYYSNPETKEKRSRAMKEYYSNPENREKTGRAMKEVFSTPHGRMHMSKISKEYNSDPKNREKQSQIMKEYYTKPENLKKKIQAMSRPEVRKKLSDAIKAIPKVTCPHCSKIVPPAPFSRWHKGGKCLTRGG
jgi:hypothetical protein